jgi:hypothetical protein
MKKMKQIYVNEKGGTIQILDIMSKSGLDLIMQEIAIMKMLNH